MTTSRTSRAGRYKSRTPWKALGATTKAFLGHARHARINFRPSQRCFVLEGRGRLRGLTRHLNAKYVPPAAELLAYHGCASTAAPRDARCQGGSATAHGSLVDAQLQGWVEGTHGLDGADPCVTRVVRTMRRMRLRPVICQPMLYDEEAGWATALDVLAVNERGQPVVLEIKTSRHPETYVRECDKRMRGALRHQPYSLWAHHQMQLAVPVAAMGRLYGTRVAAAYVLVASPPDCIDIYPLQPEFMRAALAR